MNWVLFDNQFNYVAESSGFDQVGGDQELKKHALLNLPVAKSGYLYIYLSNETQNVDVFFDNLQVSHVRGPLTEESHYYPFGLTMRGISDQAMKGRYTENKYGYNEKELQNKEFSDGKGLEEYDYGARFYDPQIGRFFTKDRYAEKYYWSSPFQYGGNDPIKNIDNNGDSTLTYFYNENGEQTNVIPQQLMETFASEYNIRLGYNSETHMLYGTEIEENDEDEAKSTELGDNSASQEISKTARSSMMAQLGEGHSKGALVFGYNLGVERNGETRAVGYGLELNGTAFLDLADYDNSGKFKYADYNDFHRKNPVPTRAANLGRMIEHEFLGHAIAGEKDYPMGGAAGPNEEKVGNPIRIELGLPIRLTYGRFGLFGNSKDDININGVRIVDARRLESIRKTIHK